MSDGTALRPTVVIGRISGLFGVRGWCKVHSYTEPREALLDYGAWQVGDGETWRPVTLAEGRRHGKTVVVRLDGVEDRDAAAALVGLDIAVPRASLPDVGDGRYYWHDLEGLEVRRRDGTAIGRVRELLETGANDVLVVAGERETLIPFVIGSVVLDVDLVAGRIVVDWDWD